MGFTALIAGGLGAAGSIGSALIGSSASEKASQQQAAAQQAALAQQQALYNQGLGQQSNYLNSAQTAFGTAQSALGPYAQAGQSVLPTLQSLLTPGQSAATLAQMPGFQFASQYGTKAATNALAARGQGASAGPLATAISQYNNGLASQQYQSIVGNLQGFAGLGGNAAAGIASSANNLASIYGSAGNADLGSSIQAGNAQAGTIGNIGNAQASGTLGSANALAGGLTGAGSSLSNAAIFNALGGSGNNGLYGTGNVTGNSSAVGAGTDAQYNNWALRNGLTQADL